MSGFNPIQSHCGPFRSLAEHLDDIRAAAARLTSGLPADLAEGLRTLLSATILLHDVGKATIYFQEYIDNPTAYRGSKEKKAHALLGTLYTIHLAATAPDDWPWQKTLAISATVLTHHGEFPTRRYLQTLINDPDLVEDQLKHLQHERLTRTLKTDFPHPDQILAQLADPASRLLAILDFLGDEVIQLSPESAADVRLQAQLLYSTLLETDKAWLAIAPADRDEHYRVPDTTPLPVDLIETHLDDTPASPLNQLRTATRHAVVKAAAADPQPIQTITLPTGLGKTLVAAAWMQQERQAALDRGERAPKTIIILPFLSIIDQTAKEYEKLLTSTGLEFQEAHSLAPFPTEDEAGVTEERSIDFLQATWQKSIIITTFDQFLYALFSPKGRHQLRFHNLVGARIVIDEIQALPVHLWSILDLALQRLTHAFHARALVMSATQPGFLTETRELVPDPVAIYCERRRYQFHFRHRAPILFEDFLEECAERASNEWGRKKILIVLNTRSTARELVDYLEKAGHDVRLISTELTPKDRLAHIAAIKADGFSGIVVSTQCIEAGVDIDMDFIIRDFAPLDSLIQVAGRCNRQALRDRATIEVVRLQNERGKFFGGFVYDKVLLSATSTVLADLDSLPEENVLETATRYFDLVRKNKDTGYALAEQWIRWEKFTNAKGCERTIAQLLRGARQQIQLVVIQQDPDLRADLEAAFAIEERWDRRRELKKLSRRIATITISISTHPNSERDIAQFTDSLGHLNLLRDDLYIDERGLNPDVLPEPESTLVF